MGARQTKHGIVPVYLYKPYPITLYKEAVRQTIMLDINTESRKGRDSVIKQSSPYQPTNRLLE